jgi:hypothetical protein
MCRGRRAAHVFSARWVSAAGLCAALRHRTVWLKQALSRTWQSLYVRDSDVPVSDGGTALRRVPYAGRAAVFRRAPCDAPPCSVRRSGVFGATLAPAVYGNQTGYWARSTALAVRGVGVRQAR